MTQSAIRLTRRAAIAGLASVPWRSAAAATYPAGTIRLIVGFPPGGPTDVAGRLIAQNLERQLGQSVIVMNHGGAGGTIGANMAAKAKPDGYTLLVSVEASQTRGAALFPNLQYDQVKDFTFVRKVMRQRNLLVAHPSLPVTNVTELVTYLKAHPGEINVAGTIGATPHIGSTLFDELNGTKLNFISYPGGSQPLVDTLSGVAKVGFFVEALVSQYVKIGQLKALAVVASKRSPTFPELPTVEEVIGKPLDISPWFGIVGPANLPAEVVTVIGEALDKMAASEEFAKQIEIIGAEPIRGTTPETFQKSVADDIVVWNKWAKDVNVSPNR